MGWKQVPRFFCFSHCKDWILLDNFVEFFFFFLNQWRGSAGNGKTVRFQVLLSSLLVWEYHWWKLLQKLHSPVTICNQFTCCLCFISTIHMIFWQVYLPRVFGFHVLYFFLHEQPKLMIITDLKFWKTIKYRNLNCVKKKKQLRTFLRRLLVCTWSFVAQDPGIIGLGTLVFWLIFVFYWASRPQWE